MLKIPTEQSEVVYQRTDKTIDDRKKNKIQTMVKKTLHRKFNTNRKPRLK